MSERWVKIWSTFFYIGYSPFAPGSMASLAGAVLAVLLHQSTVLYVLVFVAITAIGFKVGGAMEKITEKKDPGCVVIDEVSGIMIAFFLLPMTPAVIWTAYFLFRAFDMFKIYPVCKFEALGGGKGIMMDDIIAGIYTGVIMHIAVRIVGIM